MSGSNKPGNGDFITSPFDDAFEFEEGDNTVNNSSSNGNGHTSGSGNWNDGHKMEEKETTLADDTDIEISSIQPTPHLGGAKTGMFDDVALDNDDHNDSSREMKRLRMGTRRVKGHKPQFGNMSRNKTLKWAKKNIKNPFDDFSRDEEEENDRSTNRADQLRTVYHNIPLPEEMLDEEGNPIMEYPRNKIRTTKYTPLSFFPKNLLFQFQNFANVYFLVLIILGAFQIFGVTNPGLSAVPLIVIVIITAIKDGIEDSRRTILDLEVNNTRTHILEGVVNENVSVDNVSLWRRFKKANSRLLMQFIQWCKERMTEDGKRRRLQRQRRKLRKSTRNGHGPRNSLDSMDSYRPSADYYNRPSLDYDNMGHIVGEDEDVDIIDRTLPPRTDTRFARDYWKSVKVGDIVRIHNNDEIPADIILLSTSDSDGGCYVETKNLDGETNLKVRQALKCSYKIKTSRDIARTRFWIESEGPHANLYSYQGNLKWKDSTNNELRNEPVTINNMLLRGCTLRNTKWAMGIVVFTGDDTKIMLNAGVTPTKKSRISRELNFSVLINFLVLFILCFISGLANGIDYDKHPRSRDFFEFGTVAGNPATNGFVSFWVAVILYQSLVPISLYISVEIIKTAQAAFIYGDVLLYNAKLDYPCTPKSWNISDDLGQIEYIFSDKTGTLTQNVMEFKKCTINGVSYGRAYTEALAGLRKRQGIDVEAEGRREKEEIAKDRDVMINDLRNLSNNTQFFPDEITFISKEIVQDFKGRNGDIQKKCCEHFMLALALCHSVLTEPSPTNPDKLEMKAQSPDEAALVTTARDLGFCFMGKTKTGMVVEIQGIQKEFEILNILEFNSARKRMSCIIKIPGATPNDEPRALLICKGADSVIYSRLSTKAGENDETLLEKTALHLEQYATEGLRTLCLAQRELTWSEYTEWNARYDIAAASLTNREEQLEIVSDSIERDLILLGGTAIEDRLQDGVPESIALLAEAGIKLWVLTGDKVETAINIGFSCNLLNNDMELLVVKTAGEDVLEYGEDPHEVVNSLISKYLREKFGLSGSEMELDNAKGDHSFPKGDFAVVIDGDALKIALTGDDMKRKFLLLCKNCKAVLCCRVSPAQKAAVVKLVKNTLDVMTLAIGDGSNDVAMIQSADVGIGIAGEEGRQAVMCSDYAIGQFRYLTRLLLVHGRWSYKRLSEMIPEFFYKNVIFTLALFWYGIYNNFDGSYLFEYTYLMFYNLAFTSIPVILLGILDQDVNDTISLVVPQLYRVGILRLEWNQTKFLWYMFDGLYQSVICFFFPYLLYKRNGVVTKNGMGLEHRYYVGIIVTTIAVFACNLYILIHQYRWDWFSGFFIFLSCIVVIGWTGIWTSSFTSLDLWKAGERIYDSPSFWAVFFIGVFFCLLPRFTWDCYTQFFNPSDVQIIREMWKRGDYDHYPVGYDPTDPNRPKISKGAKFGERLGQGIVLEDETYAGGNVSRDSVFTEEIPMNIISGTDGTPRGFEMSGRTPDIPQTQWESPEREEQNLLNSPQANVGLGTFEQTVRQSIDRTRDSMLANRELDNRYSVDRARASLDLPGVTHAAALMEERKSREFR
ncbi:E1-E2 ATPases phosphorylation site [Nakaseomyces glabratus]